MKIAICDDDGLFRQTLKDNVIGYCQEKRIAADVYEFDAPDTLLADKAVFDVVFMDYQFESQDGLEAAKMMRARNFTGSIIFVTAFPQFVYDSFEVQPFRFFVKPLQEEKLRAAMDQYLRQHKLLNHIVIIQDGEQFTIDAADILYLEGDGKYCLIRTANNTYRSSKTLSQVQILLPQHCFYRIHKSYVVNMYSISCIQGRELLLVNGEKAVIARSHLKDFKKSYMDFVKNYYVRL